MNEIPREFRRITEEQIDAILHRHLSSKSGLTMWLCRALFPGTKLVCVEHAELGTGRDYRIAAGNPLAYGQTDIELIAQLRGLDGKLQTAAVLIENKVDARQSDNQGTRYHARAEYRRNLGAWDLFKCILIAPQAYLENAYPYSGFRGDGWDAVLALDDIAQVLKADHAPPRDIATLLEAIKPSNAFNKPIPDAVRFWKDLTKFQRAFHPDVPIFASPQAGARINVWPSFYENQLRNNKQEIRRKYIQLAHSGKRHVSLFVKNVRYPDFAPIVKPILEPEMMIGRPGGSWQSIQVRVPEIDPCLTVEAQAEELDKVFAAARRLYEFFLIHETALLSIQRFK